MCVVLSQLLSVSPLQRSSEDEWNWGTPEAATSSATPLGFEVGAQNRLTTPMFPLFQRKYYWSSKPSSGLQLINVSWYILKHRQIQILEKAYSLFYDRRLNLCWTNILFFSLQERHLVQPLPHLRGSNISVYVGSEGFLRCSPGKEHRKKTLWPVPKNCTRENIQNTITGDGNLMGSGLQQNKCTISLSNSLKNTPATEKALFPNIFFKLYITVMSLINHAHTISLDLALFLCLFILSWCLSIYDILGIWKPSSFHDKDHERKKCSCPQKRFRKLQACGKKRSSKKLFLCHNQIRCYDLH